MRRDRTHEPVTFKSFRSGFAFLLVRRHRLAGCARARVFDHSVSGANGGENEHHVEGLHFKSLANGEWKSLCVCVKDVREERRDER